MATINGDNLTPLSDCIFAIGLEFSERQSRGGILLLDDDGKIEGIRPRPAQIWKVGQNVTDVKPDQYILIEHGRWSRKFLVNINDNEVPVWLIDPNGILLVSDEPLYNRVEVVLKDGIKPENIELQENKFQG